MVSAAWRAFEAELARWRDAGREVDFWWRDDDAAAPSAAFERLVGLARRSGVPLSLAVVPLGAEPAIFESLPGAVAALQHGGDHRNRAAVGAKKTEFPDAEDEATALERLGAGRARLAALAGAHFVPVLAPPWNRFPESRKALLPGSGYRAISQYGARDNATPAPGLMQINAHVDLVAWRGDGGFVGEAQALRSALGHLLAKRDGSADRDEPTGWLTHHARHDAAAWRFLERLFETAARPGVRWLGAREVFHI